MLVFCKDGVQGVRKIRRQGALDGCDLAMQELLGLLKQIEKELRGMEKAAKKGPAEEYLTDLRTEPLRGGDSVRPHCQVSQDVGIQPA